MPKLILGSSSPRRAEILSYFDLPFEQVISPFNENSVPYLGDPEEFVRLIARGKGEALVDSHPTQPILTADTVVYKKGRIYTKPRTEQEGFETLAALVGKEHTVYTGVALCLGSESWYDVAATKVLMHDLTSEQIRRYQQAIHCADKAGGYAVQKGGSLIIERVEGCFYNVMGLPIQTVQRLLLHVRIDLWDHIAPC